MIVHSPSRERNESLRVRARYASAFAVRTARARVHKGGRMEGSTSARDIWAHTIRRSEKTELRLKWSLLDGRWYADARWWRRNPMTGEFHPSFKGVAIPLELFQEFHGCIDEMNDQRSSLPSQDLP